MASQAGDAWKLASTIVYATSLIWLYTVSTLYHSLQGRSKKIFQKLDHIAIYFLIAGTYTPFCLTSLRGVWGWWLFGINWGLAFIGTIFELTLANKTRKPSLFIYFIMGWLVLVAIRPLIQVLPIGGLILLSVGGILYSTGVIFFLLDERIRHFHGIWHLFVLGGTVCQFFSIALYLI